MSAKGKKPKPTALKELEGNPGRRPLNKNEPKPRAVMPRCPSWLDDEAKKEWARMSKRLDSLGLLTEVDGSAFAGYCQAYARWKQAEEFITKHGFVIKTPSGYLQPMPHVSIAQSYMKAMQKFCEEFGMTPASRCRLSGEDQSEEDDPMEGLLFGVMRRM